MGRKKTACDGCAAIKIICSRDAGACARCKRLSLPCSLAPFARIVQVDEPQKRGGSRIRHTRTNTGCVNCRNRRKKCDERRPACGDCSRLRLICVRRTGASRGESAKSTASDEDELQPPAVGFAGSASPDGSQHQPEATHPSPSNWIALIDEEYTSGASRAGFSLANSSALDVLPQDRASDDRAIGGSTFLPSTALGHLAGITAQSLEGWTIGERHLLNHFLQSVSRSLVTVKDDENPFIGTIVPMALENDSVRHALIALSACHLARMYPNFEQNVLMHRSHALECLKQELGSGVATVSALATTLLMCLVEICQGTSRRWLLYLQGARAVLSGVDVSTVEKPLDFLIDLYDYLCCMGSITQDIVPQPLSQRIGLMDVGPSGIHPLFGVGSDLYHCLARINQLAVTARTYGSPSEASRDSLHEQARDIELALQSWAPPDGDLSVNRDEAKAAAFAVQWAAMLRLREISPVGHDDGVDRNQGPIDYILSAVSLIRSGSRAEAHLLFPLLMAGVSATTKASRLTLDVRLNIIKTTIGFGHIACGHQLLDEVWRRANKGEQWQWKDLMRIVAPGLILF